MHDIHIIIMAGGVGSRVWCTCHTGNTLASKAQGRKIIIEICL